MTGVFAILAAVQVFFSPHGGCTAQIVKDIASAKQTVHVEAYSFTSKPIIEALCLKSKKVAVVVIVDGSWQTSAPASVAQFQAWHIPVLVDSEHPIAHSKVIIIDDKLVLTGSFNFTKQAESNHENVVRISTKSVVAQYEKDWEAHAMHSAPPDPSAKARVMPTTFDE